MKQKTESIWLHASLYIFYGLLAYMPLHILLSTWAGTSFGVLEFARIAKEVVLIIGAGLGLIAGIQKGVAQKLMRDKLMWLIAAFVGLHILLALWRKTDQDAELLGIIYNVRFLIYFVWAILLAKLYNTKELMTTSVKIVLAVGLATIIFGLLQYLILPDDALRHLGYSRGNGVLPAFFIDDKPDLERIMSTVRDPNSFGSYLLILLGFFGVRSLWADDGKKKIQYAGFVLLTLLAVFWTFSRAAWIGAATTLGVVAILSAFRQRFRLYAYKTPIIIAATLFVFLGAVTLYAYKDSYLVKNVVIHADESTVLEDPNELRIRYWRESIGDIVSEPLGVGPGTAGLTSIRNDKRTVLNENYYLQIGQEVGILGLALFLAIIFVVAKRLYIKARARDPVAVALIASLAGLMVTNFLAHIWANEAVAYTWWGLAGLAVVSNTNNNKQNR